jgi:hypothetical protein
MSIAPEVNGTNIDSGFSRIPAIPGMGLHSSTSLLNLSHFW